MDVELEVDEEVKLEVAAELDFVDTSPVDTALVVLEEETWALVDADAVERSG